MGIIIISFDALEYDLVEKYELNILKQKEHGKIDLEYYLHHRPKGYGSGDPLTAEIYPIFLTGIVPDDYKTMAKKMDKEYGSIFKLTSRYVAIDIPSYSPPSWMGRVAGHPLFESFFLKTIPLDIIQREYLKYATIKASYASLIKMLNYDLVFWYFKFLDSLGHIYADKFEDRKRLIYEKAEWLAKRIIDVWDDGNNLIIIFSDHGQTVEGTHSHHGFWS